MNDFSQLASTSAARSRIALLPPRRGKLPMPSMEIDAYLLAREVARRAKHAAMIEDRRGQSEPYSAVDRRAG